MGWISVSACDFGLVVFSGIFVCYLGFFVVCLGFCVFMGFFCVWFCFLCVCFRGFLHVSWLFSFPQKLPHSFCCVTGLMCAIIYTR